MEKKIKKFNPENWQGRSKQQVESNYKVMGYGCAFVLVMFVVLALMNAINSALV